MAGNLLNESNNLTPEPATFLMLGGGLLAVAALLRRMRKLWTANACKPRTCPARSAAGPRGRRQSKTAPPSLP